MFRMELNSVQFHLQFGIQKCKLLITAKPYKLNQTEKILKSEPEILTFYDKPVTLVENYYVRLGVPQAPRQQSKILVDYRLEKAMSLVYLMQDATKNALLGISPICNRNIFNCYNQPTFFFGLDTIDVNCT